MKTETTIEREVTHSREGVGGPSEPRDDFAFFIKKGEGVRRSTKGLLELIFWISLVTIVLLFVWGFDQWEIQEAIKPSPPSDLWERSGTMNSNFGHVSIRVGKESSAVVIWGPASIGELKDMAYALGEYFRECEPEARFYRTGPETGQQVTVVNLSGDQGDFYIDLDE
jgi:hypothetical protein